MDTISIKDKSQRSSNLHLRGQSTSNKSLHEKLLKDKSAHDKSAHDKSAHDRSQKSLRDRSIREKSYDSQSRNKSQRDLSQDSEKFKPFESLCTRTKLKLNRNMISHREEPVTSGRDQ